MNDINEYIEEEMADEIQWILFAVSQAWIEQMVREIQSDSE